MTNVQISYTGYGVVALIDTGSNLTYSNLETTYISSPGTFLRNIDEDYCHRHHHNMKKQNNTINDTVH